MDKVPLVPAVKTAVSLDDPVIVITFPSTATSSTVKAVTVTSGLLELTVKTGVPSACDTSNAFASSEPGITSTLFVAIFNPKVVPLSPSLIANKLLALPPPSVST